MLKEGPTHFWFVHGRCGQSAAKSFAARSLAWTLVLVATATTAFAAGQEQAKPPAVATENQASGDARAVAEIEHQLANYVAAVNAEPVNLTLASQVWSNSPDVSIFFPLGEVRGWENVKRDFYENIFEAMFSERNLTMRDIHVHVYGDSAWVELHWHFTAKLRKDGSIKNSDGVETQIYRAAGPHKWRLVHVHYSVPIASAPPGATVQP